jgi:TP901 family phage tail tape measure protein
MKKNYSSTIRLNADTKDVEKSFKGLNTALNSSSDCLKSFDKVINGVDKGTKLRNQFKNSVTEVKRLTGEVQTASAALKGYQKSIEGVTEKTKEQAEKEAYFSKRLGSIERQRKREITLLADKKKALGGNTRALVEMMEKEGRYDSMIARRERRMGALQKKRDRYSQFAQIGRELPFASALMGNPALAVGSRLGGMLIPGRMGGAFLGGAIGLGAAGLGLAGGAIAGQYQQRIGQIRENEYQYRILQNTGGFSDRERIALKDRVRGVSGRTGKTEEALLEGLQTLTAEGIDLKNSQEMIETVAKAAVGTNSDIGDLAALTASLKNNFGIVPKTFESALDKLATGGKLGSFELKDMAAYLPSLGAKFQQHGMGNSQSLGSVAAMLQIVKKGAKDPAQAANNLENLLSKMTAGPTAAAFKKKGVNLEGFLKSWKTEMPEAENKVEAFIMKVKELTKDGKDSFALNQLFGDQQVKDAMLLLVTNWDQYQQMKVDIARTANGTIKTDFNNATTEMEGSTKRLNGAWNRATESMGNAMTPVRVKFNNDLTMMLNHATTVIPLIASALAALSRFSISGLLDGGFSDKHNERVNKAIARATGSGSPFVGTKEQKNSVWALPTFAGGGSLASGQTALVGEQGPEVIRMGNTGGYVHPNRALTNGGGGNVVNVYVNTLPSQSQMDAFIRGVAHRQNTRMYDAPRY